MKGIVSILLLRLSFMTKFSRNKQFCMVLNVYLQWRDLSKQSATYLVRRLKCCKSCKCRLKFYNLLFFLPTVVGSFLHQRYSHVTITCSQLWSFAMHSHGQWTLKRLGRNRTLEISSKSELKVECPVTELFLFEVLTF